MKREKQDFKFLWEQFSTVFIFFLILCFFSIENNKFLSVGTIESVIRKSPYLMLIVMGLTVIMIGGGIDFSIGYQISLLSVVISMLGGYKFSSGIVLFIVILTGAILGLINGFLVGILKIQAFAATIGTSILYRGVSYFISQGKMSSRFPDVIYYLAKRKVFKVSLDIWLAFAGICVIIILFHFTYYGKYIQAMGLKESTAKNMGIPVEIVKCTTYVIAGVFYGMAAMIVCSKQGYAGSDNGIGIEITALIAAYIGGILGQKNKIALWKIILGVFIIELIEQGLPTVGISAYVQYIVTGIIVIISLILNRNDK